MTHPTTPDPALYSSYSASGKRLANSGPAWLRRLRKAGMARFRELGFPTSKLEEWKTTNVSPIVETPFRPAHRDDRSFDGAELPAAARLGLGGPRLVFADGYFVPRLSNEETTDAGIWVGSLARALETIPERLERGLAGRDLEQCTAFCALNSAVVEDGAVVLVPDGVELERPIELIFASSGGEPKAASPRTLIAAGAGARARIVETYVGPDDGAYLTNAVTDVSVGDGAVVDHYRLQLEGTSAFHVATCASRQAARSDYTAHNINIGGRLARHDVVGVLDGEGAVCRLNGLYLTRGTQHVDNHTVLDHAQPHCDSRELYKGILDGGSRAVFNGRIIVRPDAQRTDAKQSNPNLILSDGALAHTRPQLEIYADDVKCTHGATVGRLDENAIFYLRSRGIGRDDARNLLIRAFAGEVLERVAIEPLRELLEQAVEARLLHTEN